MAVTAEREKNGVGGVGWGTWKEGKKEGKRNRG